MDIKIDSTLKIIETERVILRALTEKDAEEFYGYAKDPLVGPAAGWKPHENIEESLEIIREIFLPADAFGIILKPGAIEMEGKDISEIPEGKLIGSISLEADKHRPDSNSREMGYALSSKYWGHGIMTEAAHAILKYGFEIMELDQIGICTSPINNRSQGVIKKCGFVYEGRIRRAYKVYTGECRDSLVYSMTKEEYDKKYK